MQYNASTGTTTVVNHVRYDTFGQIVGQTNTAYQPFFAYTGREWDPAVGLYFYRARWYDPRAGRFTSEDPLGFAAGDANLSRYVGNAATLWVDPSGMEREIATKLTSVRTDFNDSLASDLTGSSDPFTEPTFWDDYYHFLTEPGAMDEGLRTGFYVSGSVGLGAAAVAGGVLVAGSVAGTSLVATGGLASATTGVPTLAGNAVIGMGSAGLIGGTVSKIGGGGFISGGVTAAPAGLIGGGRLITRVESIGASRIQWTVWRDSCGWIWWRCGCCGR